MGRALVRRPKIFLLDEPLSNLDARLRANVRLELKQLHRQIQSTIVYVTHDQVEAMTLGDKVVVMREGCLQQMGAPETIYTKPANIFVATFIGSPEMNLYDGKIIHQDGKPYFQGKDFKVDLGELNHEMPEGAVQLGVRPEDVDIGDTSATAVKATLQMVSNVGSEKYLHLSLIHETLTLRAPKDAFFKLGQIIPIIIDPHRIHLFFKGDRAF